MDSGVTKKQKAFLAYLDKKISEHGKAPTLREAAADNGVSHAAISQMLKKLEKKGYVKRDGHYSRDIYLINQKSCDVSGAMRWKEVPVIGTIAAGVPLYAQQEWDGSIVIDRNMFKGSNLFALKIQGDSMKNAAILSQDIVICEPCQYAKNGEIVVALIRDEEATCKKFFLRQDCIELCPENPDYNPVKYEFNEILIQGKVIGVVRGVICKDRT